MKRRKIIVKNKPIVPLGKHPNSTSKNRHTFPCSPPTSLDKLDTMKEYGKKEVFWTLTQKEKEDIEAAGYLVKPFIYKIHTKRFSKKALEHAPSVIKHIHHGAVCGKKFIAYRLKLTDIELLTNTGISYKVLKYRIILNS